MGLVSLHFKFRFPLCNYASRFKGYNLSLPLGKHP